MLLLAFAGHASACSPVDAIPVFTPDVREEAGRMVLSMEVAGRDDNLRAIDARVVSLRRAEPADTCNFGASAKVEVSWAAPTDVRLEDIGIYFKVRSGTDGLGKAGHRALNDLPRTVQIENGKVFVYLNVGDTPARPREAIDLDVEVFAIDKFLHIGPSSRLRIRSKD